MLLLFRERFRFVLSLVAKQEASQAVTEVKKANMQLDFCSTQLKQKEKELGTNTSDYTRDQSLYNKAEKEVKDLEVSFIVTVKLFCPLVILKRILVYFY